MWQKELLYEGDVVELDGSGFELELLKDENLMRGKLNKATVDQGGYKLYQLKIPVSTIVPQKFNLYCYKPGGTDSVKLKYEVIWNNKPKSLLDIDYATEMMYYVLDDTQYSELKSGKDEERFEYLLKYWQTQDHTPETPFIEAMEVYFNRVDYAQEAYSTVKHKDGARTPRGQICILYGKPDYVETMVEKKIVKEIWEYDKLQLRFVFNVTSPGVYVLVETNAVQAGK
jgi:GWxTD domain-containing protein